MHAHDLVPPQPDVTDDDRPRERSNGLVAGAPDPLPAPPARAEPKPGARRDSFLMVLLRALAVPHT